MGALRVAIAALALTAAAPAAASPVDRWRPLIAEASARFGVPEEWIARVMQAESAGRTTREGRSITSGAGAMGLMQVMPETFAEMARTHGLGPDPHQPRDNILAGTAYLRAMYDRYGYPGLFAAYNAGPRRYDQYLRDGRVLPGETRVYLAQLTRVQPGAAVAVGLVMSQSESGNKRAPVSLFFVQKPTRPAPVAAAASAPKDTVFIVLNGSPEGGK